VVAMGGFFDSDYALPAGRVAERARIPMVTSGATAPDQPKIVGRYFFMACYGDDDQARAAAHFTRTHLKAKRVVLLAEAKHIYTQTLAKFYTSSFQAEGGQISQTLSFSDRDEPASVVAAIKSRPDAIYVACLPDSAGPYTAALRKGGFQQPIVSGDGFDTPDLVRVAGPSAQNVFYTTHYAPASPAPRVRSFVSAYQARFGKAPGSASDALAYDTMRLIADAIRRAGSATPEAIRRSLASTRGFQGVTGTISYRPGVRKPSKQIFVLAIKNGKPAYVETLSP
jgi:branched-chain amino acid transport system substrate-binding protein